MTVTRRTTPRPDLDPRDAELQVLRDRIKLIVATCDVQMGKHKSNGDLCDALLDIRNLATTRRSR